MKKNTKQFLKMKLIFETIFFKDYLYYTVNEI